MAEGKSAAQLTPQARPTTTANAGANTVDAAANLAALATINESAANPGSFEEYQHDVRATKDARLAPGEAARCPTATESPRDKGAAKSRSPASSTKKDRASSKKAEG